MEYFPILLTSLYFKKIIKKEKYWQHSAMVSVAFVYTKHLLYDNGLYSYSANSIYYLGFTISFYLGSEYRYMVRIDKYIVMYFNGGSDGNQKYG